MFGIAYVDSLGGCPSQQCNFEEGCGRWGKVDLSWKLCWKKVKIIICRTGRSLEEEDPWCQEGPGSRRYDGFSELWFFLLIRSGVGMEWQFLFRLEGWHQSAGWGPGSKTLHEVLWARINARRADQDLDFNSVTHRQAKADKVLQPEPSGDPTTVMLRHIPNRPCNADWTKFIGFEFIGFDTHPSMFEWWHCWYASTSDTPLCSWLSCLMPKGLRLPVIFVTRCFFQHFVMAVNCVQYLSYIVVVMFCIFCQWFDLM